MLGLGKAKNLLVFETDIPLPKSLQKLGLSTVSKEKKIPDHVHWIAQCLSLVPLEEVANQLNVEVAELITLFQQEKHVAYWNDYLATSIVRHSSARAAATLLSHQLDIRLVQLLPFEERSVYYQQLAKTNLNFCIHDIIDQPSTIISGSLATRLLNELRKSPYQIQAPEYYAFGFYLPSSLEKTIQEYSYSEKEHPYFSKQAEELLRGMSMRKMIRSIKN